MKQWETLHPTVAGRCDTLVWSFIELRPQWTCVFLLVQMCSSGCASSQSFMSMSLSRLLSAMSNAASVCHAESGSILDITVKDNRSILNRMPCQQGAHCTWFRLNLLCCLAPGAQGASTSGEQDADSPEVQAFKRSKSGSGKPIFPVLDLSDDLTAPALLPDLIPAGPNYPHDLPTTSHGWTSTAHRASSQPRHEDDTRPPPRLHPRRSASLSRLDALSPEPETAHSSGILAQHGDLASVDPTRRRGRVQLPAGMTHPITTTTHVGHVLETWAAESCPAHLCLGSRQDAMLEAAAQRLVTVLLHVGCMSRSSPFALQLCLILLVKLRRPARLANKYISRGSWHGCNVKCFLWAFIWQSRQSSALAKQSASWICVLCLM